MSTDMTPEEVKRILVLTATSSLRHNLGGVTITKEDLEASLGAIVAGLLGPTWQLVDFDVVDNVATFELEESE